MESLRQRRIVFIVQASQQNNAAIARLRCVRRRLARCGGRMWRISGRTEQKWLKLYNEIFPTRMDHGVLGGE